MQWNGTPGSRPPRRESLFDVIFGSRRTPPRRTTTPLRRTARQRPTPRHDGGGYGGGFGGGTPERGGREPLGIASSTLTRIGSYAAILITIVLIAVSGFAAFKLLPLVVGGSSASPSISAPPAPPGQPLLIPPDPSVVASKSITLRGSLPQDLIEKQGAKLRIIVTASDGSEMTGAEIDMPQTAGFEISGIPIAEGPNSIRAVAVIDGSEGNSSAEIMVTRDTVPPEISISDPTPGLFVSGDSITVRGKSEPDIEIQLRNETTGLLGSGRTDASGNFGVTIGMRDGVNLLAVTAIDAAGNAAKSSVEVTTSTSVGRVTIVANPATIFHSRTPKQFRLTATAIDSSGQSVVGAEVCFTIQAPGLAPIPLTPCAISDANGRASADYTFSNSWKSVGPGTILVTVTLPVGEPLSGSTGFTVKEKP